MSKANGVFTPEQDNDKTKVEPVHSYDAFHTVVAVPGVKTPSGYLIQLILIKRVECDL